MRLFSSPFLREGNKKSIFTHVFGVRENKKTFYFHSSLFGREDKILFFPDHSRKMSEIYFKQWLVAWLIFLLISLLAGPSGHAYLGSCFEMFYSSRSSASHGAYHSVSIKKILYPAVRPQCIHHQTFLRNEH